MYYSKIPEVRNGFWKSREKFQLVQKTKTDQIRLVLENVEKGPWFLSSFNFPTLIGSFGIF